MRVDCSSPDHQIWYTPAVIFMKLRTAVWCAVFILSLILSFTALIAAQVPGVVPDNSDTGTASAGSPYGLLPSVYGNTDDGTATEQDGMTVSPGRTGARKSPPDVTTDAVDSDEAPSTADD